MKILYISYDGMTDQLGQSQVLPYLIGLCNNGHEFHLISFEKKERFKKNKHIIDSLIKEKNIRWIPLTYHKNPPVISTMMDIYRLNKTISALHKNIKFDIVHCRSYISAIAGLALKKATGIKFIFDMRGFYADERVDGKIWNLSNPLYNFVYKYFKKKEKAFLINADAVISLTFSAEKIIQSWQLKQQPIPVTVIPCCADLTLFDYHKTDPLKTEALKNDLKINNGSFVLTYLGAIGTWYMLNEMLDFFKVILEKNQEAIFLFITNETSDLIFEHAVQKGIDKNSIRVVSAQRNEVPAYLALSSYSIFFITPTFSKKASSPTKQAELMGMGIPIICNSGIGDTDFVVSKYNSGYLINGFEFKGYENVAEKILKGTPNSKEVIRNGAIEFYSLEKGIATYQQVYDSLKIQ